jgi:hypothetical protein
MKTFWCSFADDVFRGVILVNAVSSRAALATINAGGLNPGGQVSLVPLPVSDGSPEVEAIYALPRLTVLSREALEQSVAIMRVGDLSTDEKDGLRAHMDVVCEPCNEATDD